MRASRLRYASKFAVFLVAAVIVAPFLLGFLVASRLLGPDRALQSASQTLSLVPGLAGQYLRRAFYTFALDRFHRSATVEFGTTFSKGGVEVRRGVFIGPMSHIGLATIEQDVLIGSGVHILSGPYTHGIHDTSRPIRDQASLPLRVTIGAGAWIGNAAVIMADVGTGAVIGAGAVVTRPIPSRTVAAGVPAKVLKTRGGADADPPPV
jgi:virginiamycin A acetyltransferase